VAGGLLALLDDVAVIAKAAAASIDDVGVVAGRAGAKAAGVVIDDTAVTPAYVTGIAPERELPIIARIALGSLRNKLLILLPGALLLSQFLPWAITPILMMGGAYLAFEGAEKVLEKITGEHHGETLEDEIRDPVAFEKERTTGAIRTDLILSAEIMAITLASVAEETFITRALVLALVGIVITFGVYGVVALLVKMDDIGLALARRQSDFSRTVGRAMVKGMPRVLTTIGAVGTVAMLWVGGGILVHGLETLGLAGPAELLRSVEHAIEGALGLLGRIAGWFANAALSAVIGLFVGLVLAFLLHRILGMRHADH
jgi:predicted DNA repair protein MutK